MDNTQRIILYGLDEEQCNQVRKNLPTSSYELFETDVVTDLIAIKATTLIINADILSQDDMEFLRSFYQEIDCCTDETILWYGSIKPPAGLEKVFKYYPSFLDVERRLKYLLLNSHKRCKKNSEFSKSIGYALMILCKIRKYPGITTKVLAEECEISTRSVLRYIETLRWCGEWIDYDPSLKGWKLSFGASALIGTWFEEEWEN